jgi:hypothetical protein
MGEYSTKVAPSLVTWTVQTAFFTLQWLDLNYIGYMTRARLLVCWALLCYAVLCARLMQWLVAAVQCLCVARCSARLWQGLRFAVLFYVLRCYAMLCEGKARAWRCLCFSIPNDGWLSLNEYEQSAAVPRVHLEWRSSLYSWRRIHCRSDRTAQGCPAESSQARWGTQDGSGTCMIQHIAMCTARLWQGLRFAVLFYVLRCYAMLCEGKG